MNWKKIKDSYPSAFEVFKWHDSPNKYYAWDVIDVDLPNKGKYKYEEDFQLRYIKGIDTENAYAYDTIDYDYKTRELYDFFDKYGLNIYIWSDKSVDSQVWYYQISWYLRKEKWLWHGKEDLDEGEDDYPIVFSDSTYGSPPHIGYEDRYKAELSAFENAFEIMNKEI